MNRHRMTYLIALLLGISVLLFATRQVFVRRNVADHLLRLSDAGGVADDTLPSVADTLSPSEAPGIQPTGTLGAINTSGGSVPIAFASSLPTGLVYRSAAAVEGVAEVAHILQTISNAVKAVDGILKTRNYKIVTQFDRPVWLEAPDKAQQRLWRIVPYRTTPIVATIKASVYRDETFTEEDPVRSFNIDLYPDTGQLRMFLWQDKHEVLSVKRNGAFDLGRDVGGNMGCIVRWDEKGDVVYSNLYDRTLMGKPVGIARQHDKPPRLGPTSAVEAATGSWRTPRP